MLARSFSRTIKALTHPEHYVALWNMLWVYGSFRRNFYRYMTAKGSYPYQPQLNTPTGKVQPTLYSSHDLLTVNEVFCRKDYDAPPTTSVVVDIGSNIGISALYFLSRNHRARCYLYEPDPANVKKLTDNLANNHQRYTLYENAVSYESGRLTFGTEASGRYGGLGVNTGTFIEVETVTINQVLETVFQQEEYIDILKLDIEGLEVATISSIQEEYLPKIGRIYIEYINSKPLEPIFPHYFRQSQRGSICRMISKTSQPH